MQDTKAEQQIEDRIKSSKYKELDYIIYDGTKHCLDAVLAMLRRTCQADVFGAIDYEEVSLTCTNYDGLNEDGEERDEFNFLTTICVGDLIFMLHGEPEIINSDSIPQHMRHLADSINRKSRKLSQILSQLKIPRKDDK